MARPPQHAYAGLARRSDAPRVWGTAVGTDMRMRGQWSSMLLLFAHVQSLVPSRAAYCNVMTPGAIAPWSRLRVSLYKQSLSTSLPAESGARLHEQVGAFSAAMC